MVCRDLGESSMLGGIIRNTGLVSFMNYGRVQTLLQVADGLAHEVRAGAGHRIGTSVRRSSSRRSGV